MQKLISLLLILTILLSFVGCSKETIPPTIPSSRLDSLSTLSPSEPVSDQTETEILEQEEIEEELHVCIPSDVTNASEVVMAAYNNLSNYPSVSMHATRIWHNLRLSTATSGWMPSGNQYHSANCERDLWYNNLTDEYFYTVSGLYSDDFRKGHSVYQTTTKGMRDGIPNQDRHYIYEWKQENADSELDVWCDELSSGYDYIEWRHSNLIVWLEPEYEIISSDDDKVIVKVREFEWTQTAAYGLFTLTMVIDKDTYAFDEIRLEGEAFSEIVTFTHSSIVDNEYWYGLYPEKFWNAPISEEYRDDDKKDWFPSYEKVMSTEPKYEWTFAD